DALPPTLNFAGPNPYIDFEASRLSVVTETTPWPRYSGRAVAGVSGFGFGGTNAHVVVSEYRPQPVRTDADAADPDAAHDADADVADADAAPAAAEDEDVARSVAEAGRRNAGELAATRPVASGGPATVLVVAGPLPSPRRMPRTTRAAGPRRTGATRTSWPPPAPSLPAAPPRSSSSPARCPPAVRRRPDGSRTGSRSRTTPSISVRSPAPWPPATTPAPAAPSSATPARNWSPGCVPSPPATPAPACSAPTPPRARATSGSSPASAPSTARWPRSCTCPTRSSPRAWTRWTNSSTSRPATWCPRCS